MTKKFIILCGRYRFFFFLIVLPWFGHVFSNKGRFGHKRKLPGFFYFLTCLIHTKCIINIDISNVFWSRTLPPNPHRVLPPTATTKTTQKRLANQSAFGPPQHPSASSWAARKVVALSRLFLCRTWSARRTITAIISLKILAFFGGQPGISEKSWFVCWLVGTKSVA